MFNKFPFGVRIIFKCISILFKIELIQLKNFFLFPAGNKPKQFKIQIFLKVLKIIFFLLHLV